MISHSMVARALLVLLCLKLAACAAIVPPLEPIQRKQKEAVISPSVVQMSLQEAIAKYSPADFAFDPEADIDYATPITIDTSLPWQAALEKAMKEAGLDVASLLPLKGKGMKVAPAPTRPLPGVGRGEPAALPSDSPVSRNAVIPAADSPQSRLAMAESPAEKECVAGSAEGDARRWISPLNGSLKSTLDDWGRSAGWTISWNLRDERTGDLDDLTLGAGNICRGSFKDAVTRLFASFPPAVKIQALFVPKNTPPLLRVSNGQEIMQ